MPKADEIEMEGVVLDTFSYYWSLLFPIQDSGRQKVRQAIFIPLSFNKGILR